MGEVQMRARREKLLNDVEKSDRLSREAKRRNRHSWGGNINEVFGIKLFLAGGEELPDRPRPTALPKTMQNWISGLRSYCDDTDPESANSSTLTTSSPREKTFNVPERLLTPTAASKAKFNRTTPDGNADDSNVPNERGDFSADGKLKRRTVSSLDLDRLSRPKKTVSRGSSANRGFPDGGSGKLTRASSVTHLATPSPKHPVRQTRTRSRDDARSSMPARPTPEGREVIKRTKETPKPRPASAVGMPRTNQQTKKPVEQTKPKATPKPKTEPKGPIANSTPKIDTNKTKPKSQTKSSDNKSNTLKQQMDLEDLEDEEPNVELKIEEPNEDPESAEANISSGTITLEKPSTPSLIDISQESPQDQPIKENPESPVPEPSKESTDSPSGEKIQEIEKSDQPVVENGADDTIRSDAGLEGRSSPSERKSVTWNDENIQRVESIEISSANQHEEFNLDEGKAEEGSTKDKKKKKKKDKEDKKKKKKP